MLNLYAVGTIQYTSMIIGSFNSHNKPQNKFPGLHLIDKKLWNKKFQKLLSIYTAVDLRERDLNLLCVQSLF